jgi:hypothetical protein
MLRSLRFAFACALVASFVGCAPQGPNDPEADEEAAQGREPLSVPFEVLSFKKSAAPLGLTVIKTKAQFKSFFGVNAPSSINFNTSWVLNYSLGVKNTGGYTAEITNVDRVGSGSNKKLVVTTNEISPGPGCFVTQSLTNPQITVKINKQNGYVVDQVANASESDCSVPNWCASALCGPGTQCNETIDACVEEAWCPKVKCANGYECSEEQNACIPRQCNQANPDCPAGFACENHIVCITFPCPANYRCYPSDPCQGVDFAGTCQGSTLKWCDAQVLHTVDCSSYGVGCDWNASQSYYDCM